MNPAHLCIASIALGLAFGLGFWAGREKNNEFFPAGIAVLFVFALIGSFTASLVMMIKSFL